MKRERIILFPGYEDVFEQNTTVDDSPKIVHPGTTLTIGKPSNRYYEFIYKSLHFNRHALSDLNDLLKLEGEEVVVISILTMKDFGSIAVLRRKDQKKIMKGALQIYANIKRGMAAKELI
ncbi:MAG: hypothetical protein WBG90_16080 [Saonia sp.]